MIKKTPFLKIPVIKTDIEQQQNSDGSIVLKSRIRLKKRPHRMTQRLVYWAKNTPDTVFLAQKKLNGEWQTVTYKEAFEKVKSIAQYLLQSKVSPERPVVILSENSIEHGLVALAALHIGVPFSPIATAYSLKSTDFAKLRHTINLLTPGLIFVQNGMQYQKALEAVAGDAEVLAVSHLLKNQTDFNSVLQTKTTGAVNVAFQNIEPETIAKILFTSGSTGLPKGVINTHNNITTSWQQITQIFPFFADEFTLVDWLPWNHTFGGNHNFGLTLYNGGSLYIDGGNPTPAGIRTTVQNLREIAPTAYFNVPRGFEELIPYLKNDKELCKHFFSRLKLFFYAGAGMPQHVWDELEMLSYSTINKRLLISSGIGMTEASPSATFNTQFGSFAGMLGTPVPELEMKLLPNGGKMEARIKGENVTRGYWRNEEATKNAFDADGFYITGDALKMIDADNPNAGLLFDGRIAEDFKLDTGTWVNVGVLKAKLITAGQGLIQDAAITGHDKSFVGAIVFPELNYCKKLSGLGSDADLTSIVTHPNVLAALQIVLNNFAKQNTGSSTLVKRALFADFTLSIDKGEITDKGSINQRNILTNYAGYVSKIYQTALSHGVVEVV